MEEKVTQRGASAYTAWSVEKDGVQRRHFPYKEAGNHVKDFRSSSLCISREASAVLAALPSRLASPFVPFAPAFRPVCFAPAFRLPSPSVPFAPAFCPVCPCLPSRLLCPCVPYVALSTQHRPLPLRLPPKRLQQQKPPPWRPLVSTKQGLCLHVVPCKQRPCELASLASVGGYFFRSSLTSVPSVV